MKILIAMPTYAKEEYALKPLLKALRSQTAQVFDLLIVDNSDTNKYIHTLLKAANEQLPGVQTRILHVNGKDRFDKILKSREQIRKYFLKERYSHLLMLDSDILLHDRAVELLLQSGEELATGVYLNAVEVGGRATIRPCIYIDVTGGARHATVQEVLTNEELEIGAAGLGCTFASRAVMEKIEFRLNKHGKGEDIMFYRDAVKEKFKPVALCAIKCAHLHFQEGDERNKQFDLKKYRVE